jgi:hypothetical protein
MSRIGLRQAVASPRMWCAVLMAATIAASCSKGNPAAPTPTTPTVHVPVIVSVTFPSTIPATPGRTSGTVAFTDASGDINHAYFNVVSTAGSPFTPFDFDPSVTGRTNGTFGFNLGCNGPNNCTGTTVLSVTLEDAHGDRSAATWFTFTYQ